MKDTSVGRAAARAVVKQKAQDRRNAAALVISLYLHENKGMHSVDTLKALCSSYKIYLESLKIAIELGLVKKIQAGKKSYYCHADYYADLLEKSKTLAVKTRKPETQHIPRPPKPKPPRTDGYLTPQQFADNLCKEMKEGEFLTRKIHEANNKESGINKPTHFSNIVKKLSGNRGRVVVTTIFSNTVLHVKGDETFRPLFMNWRQGNLDERKKQYLETISKETVETDNDFQHVDNFCGSLISRAFTMPQFVNVQMMY